MGEFFELLKIVEQEAIKEAKGEEYDWNARYRLHDLACKYGQERFDRGYQMGHRHGKEARSSELDKPKGE